MRISTKLSVAFSVAAVFLLAVGIAALVVINHLDNTLSETTFYNFQSDQVATTVRAIRLAPGKLKEHSARLSDLEQWARSDDERKLLAQVRDALTRSRSAAVAIDKLEELGTFYRKAIDREHKHLLVVHHRAVLGVIVIMVESVLLFVALMYLVRRWLLSPLLDVCENTARIAEGDASAQVRPSKEREFTQLCDALNKMAANVRSLQERVGRTEKLAAIGESCAHISQNMRGMLASIRSLAHYESSSEGADADARAAFTYIVAAVNKLDTWARDTISMARPVELRRANQQLEPVIRDALSFVEPQMTKKQLEVQFEPADDLPNVSLDRGLFEQALVGILTNAIEASPTQGNISIRTFSGPNGSVTIRIDDEGEGMTTETQRRAFEPFYSTKDHGAGLGLTVARNIITRHGGTVEIESTPQKGTSVTISLPAHEASRLSRSVPSPSIHQ